VTPQLRAALDDPKVAAAKAALDEAERAEHAMLEIAAAAERAWKEAVARREARFWAYAKALERYRERA